MKKSKLDLQTVCILRDDTCAIYGYSIIIFVSKQDSAFIKDAALLVAIAIPAHVFCKKAGQGLGNNITLLY